MRSIGTLREQLDALDEQMRARVDALYDVTATVGRLEPPAEMREWIEERFGQLETVRAQRLVKIVNRWTLEGACFNELRARRPIPAAEPVANESGPDDFCEPLTRTTADTFGRIEGARSITAANVAKADAQHGVVIFDTHDPLRWDEEQVVDAFATARRWLVAANDAQPSAVYPFVLWNCGHRSGASIAHPHLQVLLAEQRAYARVEAWRDAAARYRTQTGRSYVQDLADLHDALTLGGGTSIRWLAHLTPVKERELILVARAFDDELALAVYRALRMMIDRLGVRAFNVALYLRPIVGVAEDWSELPAIARIVDRGDAGRATSDIGAMELYAQPVIASDPFSVAEAARAARL